MSEAEYSLEITGLPTSPGETPEVPPLLGVHGPGTLDIPQPGGVYEPVYEAESSPENKDWQSAVDEQKVLCFHCRHGWLMWKYAPTRNLKPDGSPFMKREGYCLLPSRYPGAAPLPLEERFVVNCNRFEEVEDAEQAKSLAIGGYNAVTHGTDE